ncbi:hypothetical protein DMH01_12005 [Amycolatopsis sp. WAC 04182]|uniref:DUF5994 family protein n=1 Tax=Amycolatopsis sp. WAC 04182 TaxID=2203198 RepID=UPI000F77330D|nr:DUF5994 family protein [Amycolatopsis sp. WAC 04182]RSN63305.1 hypothetical protein DMH01_12005 [Amycolatopsis sp. WAC 04182]
MTTVSHRNTVAPPEHVARLRLKPKAFATGHVDGAWWPASRDLAAELPFLLVVLAVQLDHVERVTYNLTAWPSTPPRLVVESGKVRLEGFNSQHPATVTVIGTAGRRRLTLLVVPPETEPDLAHRLLMTAAHRDSVDDIETLLTGE